MAGVERPPHLTDAVNESPPLVPTAGTVLLGTTRRGVRLGELCEILGGAIAKTASSVPVESSEGP
jgi:hypothetical protein